MHVWCYEKNYSSCGFEEFSFNQFLEIYIVRNVVVYLDKTTFLNIKWFKDQIQDIIGAVLTSRLWFYNETQLKFMTKIVYHLHCISLKIHKMKAIWTILPNSHCNWSRSSPFTNLGSIEYSKCNSDELQNMRIGVVFYTTRRRVWKIFNPFQNY